MKEKIRIIVLLVIIFLFQSLIFSVKLNEIRDLNYLDKEKLLIEVQKMEDKLKSNSNDYDTISKLGVAYNILKGKFKQKVSGKNEEYLERSLNIKQDPIILAYYGLSQMQKAKDSFNPFVKLESAKKGLKIIDSAVDKAPDNFFIRVIRIKMSIKKKMFGRYPLAKDDIEYCESLYKDGRLTDEENAELLYYKAQYFEKMKEKDKAKKIYQNILNKNSNHRQEFLSIVKKSLEDL